MKGGILYNSEGERFMFERGYANNAGELASRDVVSRAELTEVNEGRGVKDDHIYLDMRHLGEERITDRLENIIHLSEDFEGVNSLKDPMPVKPGAHYAMGGIETDENGQTCIDGLYAAGECACVSMHGANRLGGNSLAETVVFGARAGRDVAGGDLDSRLDTGRATANPDEEIRIETIGTDETAVADGRSVAAGVETVPEAVSQERNRIQALLEREKGIDHSVIREQVQEAMGLHVSVFRGESGLLQALETIREARELYQSVVVEDQSRVFNTDLVHTLETRNLLDIAESITVGAIVRNEFRGAHWRQAHQERKDDEWLKHTMLTYNGGDPKVWFRPVNLNGKLQEYEPKTRSY